MLIQYILLMKELFYYTRYLVVLCSILILLSGSSFIRRSTSLATGSVVALSSEIQQSSIDSILQYLLISTVNDFHTQSPSDSIRFRDVHFGHNKVASGNNLYMLCGKYSSLKGGKNEWRSFVTIKTSGYELYLGETTYCKKFIQDNKRDLSTLLQNRFDAEYPPKN
jgi:hypothetical protein